MRNKLDFFFFWAYWYDSIQTKIMKCKYMKASDLEVKHIKQVKQSLVAATSTVLPQSCQSWLFFFFWLTLGSTEITVGKSKGENRMHHQQGLQYTFILLY